LAVFHRLSDSVFQTAFFDAIANLDVLLQEQVEVFKEP
jgi:hypothetical protein